MDIFETMMDDDIMSLKLLLKQYKKELKDLEEGTGLAKVMTAKQINEAKDDLRYHIKELEKTLGDAI